MNTGRKISDIPYSNIFTDMFPRARDINERRNKWDFIKIKSFCTAKENINTIKREPTIWENTLANDISDKGLISKIYKELARLHSRKTNNPIKNGQRSLLIFCVTYPLLKMWYWSPQYYFVIVYFSLQNCQYLHNSGNFTFIVVKTLYYYLIRILWIWQYIYFYHCVAYFLRFQCD